MTETNKNVLVDQQTVEKKLSGRLTTNKVNKWAFFACTMVGLLVLAALLIDTLIKGAGHLTPSFSLISHHQRLQWQGLKVLLSVLYG